jgi:hypothetical protein
MESNTNKNLPGRPSSETKRAKQMTVCLTELEKGVIEVRAKKNGQTLSDYGRQMILNGAVTARLTPEQIGILKDVAGLKNNLNQIAVQANKNGINSVAIKATAAINAINEILNKVR